MAPRDPREAGALLAAFVETRLVIYAAEKAGIDRGSHYDWLAQPKRTPSYGRRFRPLEEQARAAEDAEAKRLVAEFFARRGLPA